MKPTVNQQKAIDDRSGTLLISAGAGSGKTAVLTKRLAMRLSDPSFGHDISEYLIVTFTKAATAELRERLTKALTEEVAEHPDNKYALRQLSRMGLAKICTIHSFCLDLIRANFQVLGLPSKLRMADDAESQILCRGILDNILEDMYSTASKGEAEDFLKAAEVFSGAKSDKNFAESLYSLYEFLRNQPSPFAYFEKCIAMYDEAAKTDDFLCSEYGRMCAEAAKFELADIVQTANSALSLLSTDEILGAAYSPAIESDLEAIGAVLKALDCTYTDVYAVFSSFEKAKLKAVRKYEDEDFKERIKSMRESYLKKFAKLRTYYFGTSPEAIREAAKECASVLRCAYDILKRLDAEYGARKAEKGILDFSDLEHKALELLVDMSDPSSPVRTELAEKYAEGLCEIYIDEYQDVNPLQDMIFRAVSTYGADREECNRFLVGDLKQSIYRFRGAKPEIFSGYIGKFPLLGTPEAEKTSAHKIYLSNNFRCAENVIDLTNSIFSRLMREYSDDDSLIYTKIEAEKITAPCELTVILPQDGEVEEAESADEDEKAHDIDSEALYAARKIKEIVGNPDYRTADGKLYSYRDIAVLVRSANSMSKSYRRAFELEGVPLSSDAPDDFFAKPEVLLALCLFNTVDNPERDIYTAGLMRSKLYRFTDDELTEIRMASRSSSFWGSVKAFSETDEESPLAVKVRSFCEKIAAYRALSRGMPTDSLILYLYDDTGLLNITSLDGADKRESLMTLYEYARGFEKTSFRGLSAYLSYLNDLNSVGTASRADAAADAVTLMSIHRSKGLEFPICFVTALGKSFNVDSEKKELVMSDENGLGLKLKNFAGNRFFPSDNGYVSVDTPFRRAVIASERAALAEEEKRLLYVAVTRAKERLFLTASGNGTQRAIEKCAAARETGDVTSTISHACDCITWLLALCPDEVFDAIASGSETGGGTEMLTGRTVKIEPPKKAKRRASVDSAPPDAEKTAECLEYIKSSAEFRYGNENSTRIPAKLTVSQLKYGLIDLESTGEEPQPKECPQFMLETSAATGAEIGTAMHVFMQFCDFERCASGADGIAEEAERLARERFITERQKSLLESSKIAAFFASSLYRKTISESRRVYRERRFNLSIPAESLSKDCMETVGCKTPESDFVLVQGVIDCFCENADGTYTLIDFKTDYVPWGAEGERILAERHREQMAFYKTAIEKMTERKVSKSVLWSFKLGKEIVL